MLDIALDQENDISISILKENIAFLEKQIATTEKAMN